VKKNHTKNTLPVKSKKEEEEEGIHPFGQGNNKKIPTRYCWLFW
jgi:hypothetical protein